MTCTSTDISSRLTLENNSSCGSVAAHAMRPPSAPYSGPRINASENAAPAWRHPIMKGLAAAEQTIPLQFSWYGPDENGKFSDAIEDGGRNQGACGCCWAMATASVLGDRLAVKGGTEGHPYKAPYPSAAWLMLCGNSQRAPQNLQCSCGGNNFLAVQYLQDTGTKLQECWPFETATMGNFDSITNKPATEVPVGNCNSDWANTCFKCSGGDLPSIILRAATNEASHTPPGAIIVPRDDNATIAAVQREMMTYGPVLTSFTVPSDFEAWWNTNIAARSDTGRNIVKTVYTPQGSLLRESHSVALVGWGIQDGIRFWEVRNSWGLSNNRIGPGMWRMAFSQHTPSKLQTGIDIPQGDEGNYSSGPVHFEAGLWPAGLPYTLAKGKVAPGTGWQSGNGDTPINWLTVVILGALLLTLILVSVVLYNNSRKSRNS